MELLGAHESGRRTPLLEDPVVGIEPALLYTGELDDYGGVVDTIHMVGYGRSGTPATGSWDTTDRNEEQSTRCGGWVGAGDDYIETMFTTWWGFHPLNGRGGPGDSGGSMYVSATVRCISQGSRASQATTAIRR